MAALLIAMSIAAVMMTVAMPVWKHQAQREREEELVFRGQQYVHAIGLFQRKYANAYPPNVDMLAYVVWDSMFAPLPLFALSYVFEGWPAIQRGLANATTATWASVAWQSFANTLFGYAAWSALLARYPVATIAPMSLLVPVFGMGASALALGEPLNDWKLWAAALVMCGLALNLLWPRLRQALAA